MRWLIHHMLLATYSNAISNIISVGARLEKKISHSRDVVLAIESR
jgi:hypothetical protein